MKILTISFIKQISKWAKADRKPQKLLSSYKNRKLIQGVLIIYVGFKVGVKTNEIRRTFKLQPQSKCGTKHCKKGLQIMANFILNTF